MSTIPNPIVLDMDITEPQMIPMTVAVSDGTIGMSVATAVVGGAGALQDKEASYTPSTATQTDTITPDPDYDGLSSVEVTIDPMPIGSARTPTVQVEANPTITMDGNGLVTASYSKTEAITPSVTAGYVASGTSGNVTFRGSSTYQLPSKTASDLTASGDTVTAVAGFYPSAVSKAVSHGTATTPTVNVEANPSISVNSSGLITASYAKTEAITPNVSEGWVSAGTSGNVTFAGSSSYQLPSNASLSVSGSTVTAASGFYPSAVSANVAGGYLGATTIIAGQTASTHTYKVERQAATSGWYEASAVRNAGTVILNNQSIAATPTESAQTFTPTNSVSYITQVDVAAIPSTYVGSGVPTQSALTVSASTVTAPSGYYSAPASATIPQATFWTGFATEYTGSGGTRYWKATPFTEVDTSQGDTPGFLPEGHWDGEEAILLPAIPSGTTVTPSTASQTIGGANYMMEAPVTVNAVASATHTVGLTATYKNVGGRMFSITPKDTVSSAGWIGASTWTGNEWLYTALSASTYTPGSTPITIGSANTMLEGAQTIAAIPSEYVIPSGTVTLSSNTTGVDVAQYAFADVAVPWTWMGEEPTVVNSSFYSDSYLLGSTSYNGWAGSTTAKVIVASAAAGTFVASSMSQYEYLINWQFDANIVLKSTATTKAIPIRECANVYQLVTRRPNSITNITNDNFNGNTVYTFFTAPFMQYWNSSGSSTYTWSNSYGIYGTVQTPTFSNNTADSPTVTMKTPIWYARCSNTYFATGRVGDIDQTATTLKRTCKIYRVKKGTAPKEIYEGLIGIINNPL